MKNRSLIIVFLTSLLFSLASCAKITPSSQPLDSSQSDFSESSEEELYLERPEDTNLEFWITERVSDQMMEEQGCTFLPGWFGASEWLDSRYEADTSESMAVAPEVSVTYLITGYPDLMDGSAITRIKISDPCINVYGLSMLSSEEEIINRMASIGTLVDTYEGVYTYRVGRCRFSFSKTGIGINAPTTNNSGIVY